VDGYPSVIRVSPGEKIRLKIEAKLPRQYIGGSAGFACHCSAGYTLNPNIQAASDLDKLRKLIFRQRRGWQPRPALHPNPDALSHHPSISRHDCNAYDVTSCTVVGNISAPKAQTEPPMWSTPRDRLGIKQLDGVATPHCLRASTCTARAKARQRRFRFWARGQGFGMCDRRESRGDTPNF